MFVDSQMCVDVQHRACFHVIPPVQKIDIVTADVSKGSRAGKKELWQLSDESEASAASADDDAGVDEDEDDDSSADSDGVGGAHARKPRPAKLVAVSANDAERRQQRQVTLDT
jgi:hypothetical protein